MLDTPPRAPPMTVDWRLKKLGLPLTGALSERAVRAAYWRVIGGMRNHDERQPSEMSDLRIAKRELLFDLGVRVPPAKGKAGPVYPPAPRGSVRSVSEEGSCVEEAGAEGSE
jgi:hypothetical protein